MTDFRALCAELVDSVELLLEMRPVKAKPLTITEGRLSRARTLLAQPEPEGLTDEELLELMPEGFRGDLAIVSRMAAHGAGPDVGPGLFRVSLNTGALDYARAVEAAVLARTRRPTPQPPADGEVAELVEWLRKTGKLLHPDYSSSQVPYMRCAELLQLQHLQPVPVSERPPLSHECDEDGHLWLGVLETDALLGCPHFSLWSYDESRKRLGGSYTHFLPYNTPLLPAHALPLPTSEEVET